MDNYTAKNGFDGVHNYTEADQASDGGAAAPVLDNEGTAFNFVAGVRNANPTAEISPGVWNEGSVKPG